MRRFIWLVVVLAALIGGGYWFWTGSAKATDATPATYQVARGDVSETVLASGQIEASSLVSVGAQVSGKIDTLAVTLGQTVEEGALIAQIDSLDQQNAVARAKADLMKIAAQIAAKDANTRISQIAYDRQKTLFSRGSATQEVLETAEANLKVLRSESRQLEADRQSAEIALASAELALDRTRITAPMRGTVVAIVTEQGQTVNANQSTPTIVKLANLDRMVVKAEISEADVVRVKPGQTVTFSILGDPSTRFETEVRDVEPAPAAIRDSDTIATTEAIYYKGLFDVDNPDHRLRIGMTAQVSIHLAEADDVLTLPSAALGRRGDDGAYTVTVYDPVTRAQDRRAVKVGLNNNVTAEITEGLTEGDHVLASGAVTGLGSAAVDMRRRGGVMGF